jgi:aspartyl-tRNA(Asn)/glutamyl-tRNA(Gln) amidotransferase subunit C
LPPQREDLRRTKEPDGKKIVAVTAQDVRRVAALARLEFAPEEEEKLVTELNAILDYMEKLNELDTDGIEPTSHLAPVTDSFREDLPERFAGRDEVLRQAPEAHENYFRVPRIIE